MCGHMHTYARTLFLQKLRDILHSGQLVPVIQKQGYCQWSTGIDDHAWDHTSQLIRQLNPHKIYRVWESWQEYKDLVFHPGCVRAARTSYWACNGSHFPQKRRKEGCVRYIFMICTSSLQTSNCDVEKNACKGEPAQPSCWADINIVVFCGDPHT